MIHLYMVMCLFLQIYNLVLVKGKDVEMPCLYLNLVLIFFVKQYSTMNIALLDLNVNDYNVNFNKLFSVLIKNNVNKKNLDVLINWYNNSKAVVKWEGCISRCLQIKCVRQGRILSPFLFNLYINGILLSISNSSSGCCFAAFNLGCTTLYLYCLCLMTLF